MLTMGHRQPTLNIWNAGVYGLDVICYGGWYHKSENLDNEYSHRDQTLLYEDLYMKISVEFIRKSIYIVP